MKKLVLVTSFLFYIVLFVFLLTPVTHAATNACVSNTNTSGTSSQCPNGYTCWEGQSTTVGTRTSYQSCSACPAGYAQSNQECSTGGQGVSAAGACCSACKLTEGAVCQPGSGDPTQCCQSGLSCEIPAGSFEGASSVCLSQQSASCQQKENQTCTVGSSDPTQCCASPYSCEIPSGNFSQGDTGVCGLLQPTAYPTPTPTPSLTQGDCADSNQLCDTTNLPGAKPGASCSVYNYVYSQTIIDNRPFIISCKANGNLGACCNTIVSPTPTLPPPPPPCVTNAQGDCIGVNTGLGVLVPTGITGAISVLFAVLLSIAGLASITIIILSGYRIMLSQGDPEKIKGAREALTSAIIGLLFMIFAVAILQIIGVQILQIPGFTFTK